MQSLSITDEQVEESPEADKAEKGEQMDEMPANPAFKPSRFARSLYDAHMPILTTLFRRVRTGPGGDSTMANLWDAHPEPEKFKPTRRLVYCSPTIGLLSNIIQSSRRSWRD